MDLGFDPDGDMTIDEDFTSATANAIERLQEAIGADEVVVADEAEFKELFTDCEVGAMPPFGNLYDMGVYVSEQLAEDEEIAFNAGTHTELMRLAYNDFERLVRPVRLQFSEVPVG